MHMQQVLDEGFLPMPNNIANFCSVSMQELGYRNEVMYSIIVRYAHMHIIVAL